MTLRITVCRRGPIPALEVAGRLTGEEVEALEQAIGAERGCVRLELENLRSADHAGVCALRRLRAEGVALCGVPPHLAWRIETDDG